MQITKREFLKKFGLASVGITGGAFADQMPSGSVGDPSKASWARNMFPLPHTIEDGPSCYIKDGKVYEPAKELPIFHETDVVVVGGGPAGFAAAVSAARTGAKVALVERSGSLGGLFTNGLVLIMLATGRKESDGKWTLVSRGVCEEFMRRALALGSDFCTAETLPRRHWQPTVDPEAAKYLMDTMIAEAGVEMFFHSWGVDVIQDGANVRGVVFESKQGRQAILAKQVVDCTGDADMLFRAGGDYRQITHAIGFVTRLGNIDRITAKNPPVDAEGKRVPGFWPLHSNEANSDAYWMNNLGPKGNGLDVRDLSKAEVLHRKTSWEKVSKLRRTPGWEKVYISNTCSQIGPRATRLVDCETVLSRADVNKGEACQDMIGWVGHDGHANAFRVPYRAILPKKVENLLVAGRCLGTGDTIDAFRLICPCFVTGQAAGTAAGLSAKRGCAPRQLPYGALRDRLLADGACLA